MVDNAHPCACGRASSSWACMLSDTSYTPVCSCSTVVAVAMKTKTNFSWQYTYRGALRNLEHAVRRYGQSVRLFTTWRQHTSRKRHVPEETLTQFKHLITFQPGGKSFQLTPAFQQALLDAENMIAQYHASQTADRIRQGRNHQGRQRR